MGRTLATSLLQPSMVCGLAAAKLDEIQKKNVVGGIERKSVEQNA